MQVECGSGRKGACWRSRRAKGLTSGVHVQRHMAITANRHSEERLQAAAELVSGSGMVSVHLPDSVRGWRALLFERRESQSGDARTTQSAIVLPSMPPPLGDGAADGGDRLEDAQNTRCK